MLPHRGQHTQQNAKHRHHGNGQHGQPQRYGKADGYLIKHGELGAVGNAEVTVENAEHIVHIPGQKRAVQAQLLTQAVERLIRGTHAEHQARGIAGGKAQNGENNEGNAKENGNNDEDAFQNVLGHTVTLREGSRPASRAGSSICGEIRRVPDKKDAGGTYVPPD